MVPWLCAPIVCSLFMLSSVPWYGFITVSLANHLLKDIWVVSRLYTVQIKLLQTFLYKSLCEHKFSFIWDKCPGVPLLCHMVVTCLTFSETAELFSRVAYHFTFPSVICEWSILSILASIWCVLGFNFSHSDRCGLSSHFPNGYWCWIFFHVLICHLYILLGEMSLCISLLEHRNTTHKVAEIMEIYFLIVLERGSPRSRY